MRKRRRLANKLTIMVCAVLVSVSTFFYAPMDVDARESLTMSSDFPIDECSVVSADELAELTGVFPPVSANFYYFRANSANLGSFDLKDYFELSDDVLYSLDVTMDGFYTPSASNVYCHPNIFTVKNSVVYAPLDVLPSGGNGSTFSKSVTFTLLFYGSDSVFDVEFSTCFYSPNVSSIGLSFGADFSFSNLSEVSFSGSDDYQNGYNAGYSAGEQAGYGSGYSDGYADGESSVDTGAIYDEAFQAGKDSVNIDSYYDAGYDAGYQVGVQESYEIGYEAGYQSAMNRVDGWGADTTDYPVLLHTFSVDDISRWCLVAGSKSVSEMQPIQPDDLVLHYGISLSSDFVFNPFHVYKFVLDFDDLILQTDLSYVYYDDILMNLDIGGYSYPLSGSSDAYEFFYIPGDRISNSLDIIWSCFNAYTSGSSNGQIGFKFSHLDLKIFDMGPSGDTQNHIANQTDQLTNGFDSSTGDSVNSDFSSGLNEFETAEDSLFATATTGLKDFTFFDIQSVPAMVTGMSFVGSIMSGWFAQAGGASGVGIILSILFSIMLVAMVLGLYRWYQSKGGKD